MKTKAARSVSRRDVTVDEALDSALEQLGIQRVRFIALGPEQMRLALCEAIFASVKELDAAANWALSAAHFGGKTLADFSLEEIDQHFKLVHALIALACLGESAYVRPLTTYLSFPEPRWSLLIEPVLRALADGKRSSMQHGLRSPGVLRRWRKWAAGLPLSPALPTAIYHRQGASDVHWDVTFRHDSLDSLWLVSGNQWRDERSEFFDADQARTCARTFFKDLDSSRFDSFVTALNAYLVSSDEVTFASCETIAACIRDRVTQLDARAALLENWNTTFKSLSPRTHFLLFHVLKPARGDIRLATYLANALVPDVPADERLAVLGVIRQKPGLDVATLVLRACSDRTSISSSTRDVLKDVEPLVSRLVSISLRRALTDDTHNLCLLANEDASGREELGATISIQRRRLERYFRQIGELSESPEQWPRTVALVVTELLQGRGGADKSADEWRVQTRTYLGRWVAVLNEWLARSGRQMPSISEKR
jgi:hypothetical protein